MGENILGLLRGKLEVRKLYRCLLSGRVVLIVNIERDGRSTSEVNYDIVTGIYFNDVTGLYDRVNIIDGQLIDYIIEQDSFDEFDYLLFENRQKYLNKRLEKIIKGKDGIRLSEV